MESVEIEQVYTEYYRLPEQFNKVTSLTEEAIINLVERYYRTKPNTFTPSVKGGATRVVVKFSNGREVIGYSTCSVKDNFSYKLGRQIALGRALSSI